jgi:hypothetical protein
LLIKPKTLSLAWNVQPKSILNWIQRGELIAAKTLGGQYRVSSEEVARFAEARNLPLPASVKPTTPTVLVVGKKPMLRCARGRSWVLRHTEEVYEGLLLVGSLRPSLLVFDANAAESLDILRIVTSNLNALKKARLKSMHAPSVTSRVRSNSGRTSRTRSGTWKS